MLVVGVAEATLDARERKAFVDGTRGGVVLFRRNVSEEMAAVAALTADVARAMGDERPALVAIDQEGGRVARLGAPAMRLPPMRAIGDFGDVELARRVAEAQGKELAALGITMSFAPVADVHTRATNPVIGDRAFSAHPQTVAAFAAAWADGLAKGGVLSCAKHFPGHGDTTVDSHLALPHVDRGRRGLDHIELVPFRALSGPEARFAVPSMMTAHVVYAALDPEQPATLSHAICTDLLRQELGFEGVLFSDDLEMKALAHPPAESAVLAVLAGCDVVLVCSRADDADAVHEALVREAERSPAFRARCEEAWGRAIAMRRRVVPKPETDAARLEAIFAASEPVADELARRISAGGIP